MASIPLIVITFWIIVAIKKKHSKEVLKSRILLTLSLIFMVLQPSFVRAFFKALVCTTVEGRAYLLNFIAEECWSDSHLKIIFFLIFPCLCMLMIIIPGLILIYVMKINQTLSRTDVVFNFFSGSYIRKFFLWDFALMLQKFLIIILITFLENSFILLININFITFFYLGIQLKVRPYKKPEANSLATHARIALIMSCYYMLILKRTSGDAVTLLIFFALIITNLALISIFLISYFKRIPLCISFVHRLFPSLQKYYQLNPDFSPTNPKSSKIKLNFSSIISFRK